MDTYLTFTVSGVSAPVQGAKLRLYAGSRHRKRPSRLHDHCLLVGNRDHVVDEAIANERRP